jgi:carboxymethylenebutenolidase
VHLTGPFGSEPGRLDRLTRRGFGVSLFTAGYAAAVRPVNAAAITTDEIGLITAEVRYPAFKGYKLPAYIARPDDGVAVKKRAAIVVASEVFGIHAYIKDVCRRFAKLGYVAIAPDYFDRTGDPSTLTMDRFKEVMTMVVKAKYAQVMGDTDATVAYLKSQPFVDSGKLGVTGFCWGGDVVWMACEHSSAFKAGAAWYGSLRKSPPGYNLPTENRPYPIDAAATLKAPVLGLYAQNDQGILQDEVDAMNRALKAAAKSNAAAKGSGIIVYPDTEHGFHADYRSTYNEAAAKDGWARTLAFFKQHDVA